MADELLTPARAMATWLAQDGQNAAAAIMRDLIWEIERLRGLATAPKHAPRAALLDAEMQCIDAAVRAEILSRPELDTDDDALVIGDKEEDRE